MINGSLIRRKATEERPKGGKGLYGRLGTGEQTRNDRSTKEYWADGVQLDIVPPFDPESKAILCNGQPELTGQVHLQPTGPHLHRASSVPMKSISRPISILGWMLSGVVIAGIETERM
jgi:hypothetical protein